MSNDNADLHVEGHAGQQAVAALMAFGTDTMFTLNGGHIWPLYDAARDQGMKVVDTRHEQTATLSATTSAFFNGSPLVVLGGRAPQGRWGSGSLQEFDHVPVMQSITKSAATVTDAAQAGAMVHAAARLSMTPHRGPTFLDFPLDVFGPAAGDIPAVDECVGLGAAPDDEEVDRLAALIANAERPAFIVGSDVYWDGAWAALRAAAEHLRVPCFFNGLGRGTLPADHELAFLRTRGLLKARADLVVVWGTPLDFRLGFGRFGNAQVAHVVDSNQQRATHVDVPTVAGDSNLVLRALADGPGPSIDRAGWIAELRAAEEKGRAADAELLGDNSAPIKPSRIYGELGRRMARDAVVICDGGDFASYAGKFVEVFEPGCWLDTGPYGCLGNGPGYAIAARTVRPSSQIVLLLGDGAAGFSMMDVDTMVRHQLPVVMVVGNNGMWGLEKHPMQAIYGWDMACDLQPGLQYDQVVKALGGAGETVTQPGEIGPAMDRAFASGVPYMVNVLTDPSDVYPRTSNLG